jgi:hypothetical protein
MPLNRSEIVSWRLARTRRGRLRRDVPVVETIPARAARSSTANGYLLVKRSTSAAGGPSAAGGLPGLAEPARANRVTAGP